MSTSLTQPQSGSRKLLCREDGTGDAIYNTRFENVTWNQEKWQLSTTKLDQGHYQSRAAVANGYIGINVAAVGPFFEVDAQVDGDNVNGWPLFQRRQTFATIGGFFDSQPTTNGTNYEWLNQYGGESVISGIPHWSGLVVDLGGDKFIDASIDSKTISGFETMLDMKQGLMSWAFTWTPEEGTSFDIEYQMFAHKLYVNQALVQLKITPSVNYNVTVANVLNGDSAVRTNFAGSGTDGRLIYSAVTPDGVNNVTAFVYATMDLSNTKGLETYPLAQRPYVGHNSSSIAQAANVSLSAGVTAVLTKYVGAASSDGFEDPKTVAREAALAALGAGFNDSLASHAAEWASIFTNDSVESYIVPESGDLPKDDFIIEQAITAVTNPYSLLQNTIGQNALDATNGARVNEHSISVGGLTSDSYAGLIFWDAEIWMQPGLVAAFPQAAKGIANYRVARYGQAKANTETAYQSSKNKTRFSGGAAVFPWTSGRYGNCTGTGPCFDYEYHINGDIAQEFVNYWLTSGDESFFQEQLFPIYDSIATFYSEVMTKNADSKYALTNMTDPVSCNLNNYIRSLCLPLQDEYANQKDNGGFTMPLIADTLLNANQFRAKYSLETNETWSTQAQNVVIERNDDAQISLEYSGMNGSINVKQADVVLKTFPLRYEEDYGTKDAQSDLDYYAAKQSLDGPGMTYAIFSIVANQVSESGCSAYTYQQYSEQPYARAPWFQFSEQLVDDYTPNGGTHPAYPFLTGHGGAYQVVLFGYLGLRLVPDSNLHVNPSLPPQIPHLRYRTFYWQGWPISAASNQTHTTLNRLSTPISTANTTYNTAPITVVVGPSSGNTSTLSLPPNGTVTVVNRQYGLINTVVGNLVQCRPITSPNTFSPGQFPIGAVDGAASTKWQPSLANQSASITVGLPVGELIGAFYFDWAQNPPLNFSIVFYNETTEANGGLHTSTHLNVASQSNVSVSHPYNASQADLLVPYASNTTRITLPKPVYAAQYATLTVIGNQGLEDPFNGTGPTIAEWAVIRAGTSAQGKRDAQSADEILSMRRDAGATYSTDSVLQRFRRTMKRGFDRRN